MYELRVRGMQCECSRMCASRWAISATRTRRTRARLMVTTACASAVAPCTPCGAVRSRSISSRAVRRPEYALASSMSSFTVQPLLDVDFGPHACADVQGAHIAVVSARGEGEGVRAAFEEH